MSDIHAKRALFERLLTEVKTLADNMQTAARTAHEAATHEENKPENDKDTRGLEASYLAGSQAKRAAELAVSLTQLRAFADAYTPKSADGGIALGHIVTVQDPRPRRVWLLPAGAGLKLRDDAGELAVITPTSPLGEALLGQAPGDTVEVGEEPRIARVRVVSAV